MVRASELLELPVRPKSEYFDLDPAIEELSERVLEHFAHHRPGPDSFPSLSLRVLNLVADPEVRIAELSQIISRDAALSAAILKVANSAAFAGMRELDSIREAVTRLGLHEVSYIAGALSARTLFNPRTRAENALMGERWTTLFYESTAIAMVSASLALNLSQGRSDRAFLGGLLHDIGKPIALRSIASLMLDEVIPKDLAASTIDGVIDGVHVAIGGEVHREWALPEALTELCLHHHDEQVPFEGDATDLHVVRLVSALCLWRTDPDRFAGAPYEAAQSAEVLRFDERRLRVIDTDLQKTAERVRELFAAKL